MANTTVAKETIIKESDTKCIESPKYTCALGGALAVITNIHRFIPIAHAGMGCATSQNLSFRSGGGNQGVTYLNGFMTPATNLGEKEVVFGGEERLSNEIKGAIEVIDGDAYVVASGCISGMIGDDVAAVVKEFKDGDLPVAYVNSSGFLGNTFYGYDETLVALIEQLTAAKEKVKRRVNLLGFVPYQDLFWRNNLKNIGDILRDLGLEVVQVLGDFSGMGGLQSLPSSELTIVVNAWVGHKAAKKLEELYGVPYLAYPHLPVGPRDTSDFIRTIGNALKMPKRKIESYIAQQEEQAYFELDIAADTSALFSTSLPFSILADSATAIGITRFLANEGGYTPVAVIIKDDPPQEIRDALVKLLTNLGAGISPKVYFEVDSWEIRKILKDSYYRVLFASSQERYFAAEERQVFLSVSFPANDRLVVNIGYAGYAGGITLLEDFLSKFVQPF